MKKLLLQILGTAVFVVAVGLLVKNSGTANILMVSPTPAPTKTIVLGTKTLKIEVVDTEPKRELGLSKRSSLPEDQGMLFVFDKKQTFVNFWMKDMQFPIDIIWISGDKIVKIDKNAEVQKGVADDKLKIYSTTFPIDYVLEVNKGFTDTYKVKIGDTINLSKVL